MGDRYQIAIIGSGPAGLSAAGRAAERGLTYILLEKTDHLSDTIYCYQRGKDVMASPVQLVRRSDFDFEAGKREAVLKTWVERASDLKLNVQYNSEVKAISGARGDFTLTLANGGQIAAEVVILAIGTQGNPNLMRCEGAGLPQVQYSLADPGEYIDEHIVVIGAGDAAIENALGLAEDPAQANLVTLINRGAEFAKAKEANVVKLMRARDEGRITILTDTSPDRIEPGLLTVKSPEGVSTLRCERVIARMGSSAPRAFVESAGINFTSPAPTAFPELSETFETSAPGVYVIGALAGFPLIKHCMNQGYDVVEFICGNTELKPADEPILKARLAHLSSKRSVETWIEFLRERVEILNGVSRLQMRELLLDAEVREYSSGEVVFEKAAIGSSLFGIARGSVRVEIDADDPSKTVLIGAGSIVGEVGLISGRRRGATVRAAEDSILIEIPRSTALKLMGTVAETDEAVKRISLERQILQIFGSGLSPKDIGEVLAKAKVEKFDPDKTVIEEGDDSYDIYIVRYGSMIVEKQIGAKPVFLSYIPAGSYFGEMALVEGGARTASVRAAIASEVVKLDGDLFRRLLRGNPALVRKLRSDMAARRNVNDFIEEQKETFEGVVDMYSKVADFLVHQGIGEATDVLLIDQNLCVGCDNCERACADIHQGLSRLDREAGKTYDNLHVPTSCRHCEHPHCMKECPPNAIQRGQDGEVFINQATCIGCGACERNCPYGVIRMAKAPDKKPNLLSWVLFGGGAKESDSHAGSHAHEKEKPSKGKPGSAPGKKAIKCDMCSGVTGGPACVRACPTGAAIRVSPEKFLSVAMMKRGA